MKKIHVLLLIVYIASLMTACAPAETVVIGEERDAVLAFSEAKTDNLLNGMNANDYAVFSQDFDAEMRNAMPQSGFDALKKDRDETLGLYVSRSVNRVVKDGDFYAVIYDAVFEKDDAVSIRVVFRIAEPHEVSGLWFSK
ncbi:MAG TPA: DUF3887 domain-containing protein [Anaerolineales bacterium]|nr:DUF3887 domain-containing protein [Anaerolineales bacterium]